MEQLVGGGAMVLAGMGLIAGSGPEGRRVRRPILGLLGLLWITLGLVLFGIGVLRV